MIKILSKLLHVANTSPDASSRRGFYEMKSRILRRFGTVDGYDLQHIPGKQCWNCDGTGMFEHWSGDRGDCYRCGGNGWYRDPRWVVLDRWKLGVFTFHIPGQVHREEPNVGTAVDRIDGFIAHSKKYSLRQTNWAHFVLATIFSWPLLRYIAAEWFLGTRVGRIWKQFTRRCIQCKRRRFRLDFHGWKCRACEYPVKAQVIKDDEDPPF